MNIFFLYNLNKRIRIPLFYVVHIEFSFIRALLVFPLRANIFFLLNCFFFNFLVLEMFIVIIMRVIYGICVMTLS